jgi:hypothetical protein
MQRAHPTQSELKMMVLTCPHCHTQVSFGAHVCTGCHAEVYYGPPRAMRVLLGFTALFIAFFIGYLTNFIVGVIAFVAVKVGGWRYLLSMYRDRSEFIRLYKTR